MYFFANITASDNGDFLDFVANLGGKVDAVATDSADVNITSRRSYGGFRGLLMEVEKFIEGFFGG